VIGVYAILGYFESAPSLELPKVDRPTERSVGGMVAPNAPAQGSAEHLSPFSYQDYTITPLATFDVRALVLSRQRYRFNRAARLSPVDLALGWGYMSDDQIVSNISVSQGKRWYFWRQKHNVLPPIQIQHQSANMHMLPANEKVREHLLKARKGDVVEFSGYLVRVWGTDGFRWRSSTSRTDVGAGACEVVWVRDFSVVN